MRGLHRVAAEGLRPASASGSAMVGNATMPGPGGQPYSGRVPPDQGSTGAALGNQPSNHQDSLR